MSGTLQKQLRGNPNVPLVFLDEAEARDALQCKKLNADEFQRVHNAVNRWVLEREKIQNVASLLSALRAKDKAAASLLLAADDWPDARMSDAMDVFSNMCNRPQVNVNLSERERIWIGRSGLALMNALFADRINECGRS